MDANNASESKIIKVFEWCTEIPTLNHPRKSSVFVVNGNEFFFLLNINTIGFLCLRMKNNKSDREIRPFHTSLDIGFKNEGKLSLGKIEITKLEREEIWCIHVEDLHPKIPCDYAMGNLMKLSLSSNSMTELALRTSDVSDDESKQASLQPDILLESISKDFSKLLDDGLNYDVEFICGDQTFKAHKNVLCCRSDVFASMLLSDMVEGKSGRITIQDMDAILFQQFLRCLYTGKLQELTANTAVCLYKAGDKYHVDSLKKYCSVYLISNLTTDNFSNILILADLHNDTDFKKKIMEYIFRNEIPFAGEKWADFCKENPILANEVLNLFCRYLRKEYISLCFLHTY